MLMKTTKESETVNPKLYKDHRNTMTLTDGSDIYNRGRIQNAGVRLLVKDLGLRGLEFVEGCGPGL